MYMNNDRVARSPIIPISECLLEILDTWKFFGQVEPSAPIDLDVTLGNCMSFYGTLFACVMIVPKKEEY
jgi:hypothetical protein